MLYRIAEYISIFHPLRHHAEFEYVLDHAIDGQNIWMLCSFANNHFLAKFLRAKVALKPLDLFVFGKLSYLVDLLDGISLVHTKRFDSESHVRIMFMSDLPNIGESSRCEWP